MPQTIEKKAAPQRRRRKRRRRFPLWGKLLALILLCACAAVSLRWYGAGQSLPPDVRALVDARLPDGVEKAIIPVDGASRRGEKLEGFADIVVHYVGNPGTTARQNRGYYANPDSEVSSHFLVGLEGEILQCVPLDEKSSATSWRNGDTVSIEVCHPDEGGQFTQASYDALVGLVAWLADVGGLDESHIIRHYDVTEKLCPLYYVENPEAWEGFLEDVAAYRS